MQSGSTDAGAGWRWRADDCGARCFCCPLRQGSCRAAQVSSYGDKEAGPANDKPPAILNGVGIAQNLNAQLPLSLTFTDDHGQQVPLGSYFGKKPAILALVYYQCPMLCSEELNGLTGALQMVDEIPGKDFNVIVVSIDPSEGTDLAAAKKRSYVKRYGHPETADGWHFMTGTQANIDALTKTVGFGYVKIPGPGRQADAVCARQFDPDRDPGRQAGAVLHGRRVFAQGSAPGPRGGFVESHRFAGRQHFDLLLPLRPADQQALADRCPGSAVGRLCHAVLRWAVSCWSCSAGTSVRRTTRSTRRGREQAHRAQEQR